MRIPVPVLKDKELQSRLDEEGYVLINLLPKSAVEELSSLFHQLHDNRTDTPYDRLYTCMHNPDLEYRKRMDKEMARIIDPFLNAVFEDAKNTIYTFQIKGIGSNSALRVHQDWNFARADEGFRTYTVWIPLVDCTEDNGTLSILSGSHKTFDCIRGGSIVTTLTGHDSDVRHLLNPMKIKAGQLMLFDSALVHYSANNNSENIRVSAMTNIVSQKADMYLYFPDGNNAEHAAEYSVPDDFFLHYSDYRKEFESPPSFGTLTRVIPNPMKEFDIEVLSANAKENKTGSKFSQFLSNLFQ